MNDISHLYELSTPVLIGVVAYFIRGVLQSLKTLEKDFTEFREQYAGHRVATEENRERIERIEKKIESIDQRWLAFIMEQKAKN